MSRAHRLQKTIQQRRQDGVPRNRFTAYGTQTPLAPRLACQMQYVETVSLAGLPTIDYQWKINSLFDPNFTGTGHQPKGFDQIQELYQRYRVYNTHYKVSWSIPSAGFTNLLVCVVATNEASGFTSFSDATETANAQWMAIGNGYPLLTGHHLTGTVDLTKLNGKTRAAYESDDTTQALRNASPSEILHLHCVAASADGATNVAAYMTIQLTFDIEWSDPIALAQS